jgi:hypothetical protein
VKRPKKTVEPTITVIVSPVEEPNSFFSMYIEERRTRGGG